MSPSIQNFISENPNFKLAIIQQFDPDFSETDDRAAVDGTFEAIVLQLLQHYQSDTTSPEFQEIVIPEVGDTVTWKYGKGSAVGKVQRIFTEPTTLTIKGSRITRNGTPENPALVILQDDRTKVLKLASEVDITQEVDFESDVAIAYSFDFDGRYDHIDLTPTKGMIEAAKQAIVYIEDGHAGDGMESETIRWVRKVARGEPLSLEKARKGYKFFKRHNFYKRTGDAFGGLRQRTDSNPNSPAPWYVARMAWFGDPGEKFFNRVWRQIQAVDSDPEYAEHILDFGCIIHKVIRWNGLDIGCEYRPGDVRFKGSKHARKMRSGYGHARNHIGADGEALDVYLSPDFFTVNGQPSDRIFEVRQMSLEDGDFDEHKYMVGYQDMQEAKAAYLTEMPEKAFGGIREITVEMLKPYHKSVVRSFSEVEPTLDFDENGLKVKAILEAAYADGITGLENVKVEGDRITGVFLDQISPSVVKRFRFTITPDSTTFALEDPTQDFSEYIDFAKPQAPKVGAKTQSDRLGRVKTCNPEKSFPCGKTCRPNGGKCNFTNSQESKQMVQEVLAVAPKSKSKQKVERSQDEVKSGAETLTTPSDRASYAKYLKSNQRGETLTRAKRNLKKIPNPPPYIEEVAAVEMYSSAFYGQINSFLRGEQSDITPSKQKEIEGHIKMASSALEAMPKYTGVTYRGAVLPREVVDQYKQGEVVEEKAFVSTTVNQKIADDFATVEDLEDGYIPVVYEIKSKKGVSIKDFSIVPKEEEILFTPNSKFKVSKVETQDGKTKISMEEV